MSSVEMFPFIPLDVALSYGDGVDIPERAQSVALWNLCKACTGAVDRTKCEFESSCAEPSTWISIDTPSSFDYGKDQTESLWLFQVPCDDANPADDATMLNTNRQLNIYSGTDGSGS